MSDENKAYQARPRAALLAEITNVNVPKNEREWAAQERITELEQLADSLKLSWSSCSRACARVQGERDADRLRVTELEQQLADARKSERKRCAKVCDEWQLAGNAATAIRAMKDA